ncbi:MAG: hypothetical protein H0W68_00970 [Gemmatimonadaceae bacterium]|nr:hypothetical protein [Gemmatimonadaceae bacterium]
MPRPDRAPAAPAESAPRFAPAWAALAYGLATLALAWPALGGRFLVNPHSDQYIAGFAFRDFAARAITAGQGVPHWNPFMYGGLPYVAAMHGDIFYPTQLLRILLGTDAGMTWGFIIHTFLAGFLTWGFLRAWGLGFLPAIVGGMAYLLGGPIASYASPGHDGKLFVSALLPGALWILVRGMRDGRRWAWGALALVVGLGVLSPHPQLMQYFLLTSGAFALFLAFGEDSNGGPIDRRTGVRRLAFALGAVLVGMAIGGIQFAPLREYVPFSPRALGRDYAYATSFSFPIVELFNTYLPQFTGMLDKYYGPNGIHLHSEYLGGPVLMLASLSFGRAPRRAFRRFWIGALVVSLIWMLGGSTPLFRLIYELVPGTKFFRAPSTIVYVFSLSISVLAALGTERLVARTANLRVVWGWLAFGALVALLASAGVVASLSEGMAASFAQRIAAQQGYDATAVPQIIEQVMSVNRGELLAGAWRAFFFLALATSAVLAYLRGRIDARLLALALPAIIATDLWSVERHYWLFSAPARELFATDPALEFLKKEKEPGRVLVRALGADGLAASDPYFGTDGQGRGTGLMVHGIRSLTGYHGNELGRYQQLEQAPLLKDALAIMAPTFWRHENARYLYTNVAVPDSQLTLLVGPVKNSAGSTVYLYRLPGDNPYAWVASAMTRAGDADALGAVLDPRFDPRRVAAFDSAATITAPALTDAPAQATATATTTSYAPGRAVISLSEPAAAGSALVVSENYFPGWSATVDGAAQPVYRANFNLIGVALPAGARSIAISFHDAAVDTGRTITLVALFGAIGLLVVGLVTDRRRRV